MSDSALTTPAASPTAGASSPRPRGSASWISAETLMRLKNLEMRAKVVVEGFMSGLHRSPYHGFSVEFTEYRQYSPGDDLRYLDWKLFARSDRYYIKRFEDETNLRCFLLVDMSRSMGYGTLGYDKAEYAKTCAATLAYFLATQRDGVGLLTFDENIADYLPSRYRPGHLHRVMMCLERTLSGKSTNLERPLERIAALLSKRGMIVLISDLLAPIDALQRHLGYLRTQGHEVVVLRVLDPSEVDFQFRDPAMFHDVESGRDLYVDPDSVREGYLRRFGEHAEQIRQTCMGLGVDFYQLTTDQPLEMSLFDFLNARMRRGRQATRRRATNVAAGPGGGR
jgi:uncharacterized protein (DUF58 family)